MIRKNGMDIVHDSLLNKGTAFTMSERDRLHIRGLIPPRLNKMSHQVHRVMKAFEDAPDNVAKYSLLQSLLNRNETLFYKVVSENLAEMAPIIYTPTVGVACQRFGSLYQRPRGMYFSCEDRGEMISMIYNWPSEEVDVIVVTDGGRILGLGDLGAHGMGIPIGKLSLYVAAAGLTPGRTLPIMLDVGTNNQELLANPLYIGVPRPRLDGDQYFAVVDEFMSAVRSRFPAALIQFEDFTSNKAFAVLEKYRTQGPCFNDDIQGTGAVVLAGLLNAMRVRGEAFENLRKQKVVVMGAGSAGLGVINAIKQGMIRFGCTPEEASRNFYILDVDGLVTTSRKVMPFGMQDLARPDMPDGMKLEEVVDKVKPSILLGLTGSSGCFTENVVRSMAANNVRPVIFPLSNPTHLAECTAEQAFRWTEGRCIFASGSPFDPVELDGRMFYPSQSNNMFIFPGVGLGVVLSKAKMVTEEMFVKAAESLANMVPDEDIQQGIVYPRISNIHNVSMKIAVEVIRSALKDGLCRNEAEMQEYHDLESFVEDHIFEPQYEPIVVID